MKFLIAVILTCGAYAASAATFEQCQRDFKSCKNDIKNILNQKKCKKERSRCEAQAGVEAQQTNTKTSMLNGTAGNTMKNQMLNGQAGQPTLTTVEQNKLAAQQRLAERNAQQNGTSMHDKMLASAPQPPPQPVDAKEAARLRLLERQKAEQVKK